MNAQVVLEKIGVRFPSRVLFEEVNWTIYEGMRVALAGRNGSGKSTLMQIIAGYSEATEGKRSLVGSKNLRIGYLNQSVLDSAVLAHSNNQDTGTAVKYLCHKLMKEHPEIYEEEALWETGKILNGLGFNKELMGKPMGELSGGWLLRVFIGAALLVKPQLLLLDEPTNHLDISSIQWLEEFLSEEYEGSLILITHDVALQKKDNE